MTEFFRERKVSHIILSETIIHSEKQATKLYTSPPNYKAYVGYKNTSTLLEPIMFSTTKNNFFFNFWHTPVWEVSQSYHTAMKQSKTWNDGSTDWPNNLVTPWSTVPLEKLKVP